MEDAGRVRVRERVRELARHLQRVRRVERTRGDHAAERHTIDDRLDDEVAVVFRHEVEHGHDVVVAKSAGGADRCSHARQALRVARDLVG